MIIDEEWILRSSIVCQGFQGEDFDGHQVDEFPKGNLKKFLRQGINDVVKDKIPRRMNLKVTAQMTFDQIQMKEFLLKPELNEISK